MTTFGSRLSTCYRVLQKERLLTYGVDSPGQSRGISPLQWVGGWVGGIMTFGTTTGHIVSVDDHHHFITYSSCHYSPLTHFIIRSRTYAWRVWYGGGWVGGWGGGIMTFGTTTGNTYTPGSGAAIAAWIFGKAFLTCSMPKKGLASSVRRLINWTVIPDSWTYFSLMMNYDWDYQKHHRRYSGRDLVFSYLLRSKV